MATRTRWLNVNWNSVVSSALVGSVTLTQKHGEDVIDWMHRLAKDEKLDALTISEITEVPYVSVEYWMHSNGYDCDDQLAASGVRVGSVCDRG